MSKKKNPIKRLYDWVLHWAETPQGTWALFILAFAESSFFPIPPDVLLIALCLGATRKSFKYAAVCTVASVCGAIAGYTLGHYIWLTGDGSFTGFANFFFEHVPGFTHEVYGQIAEMYDKYDFWVIFTAGFSPLPYKVFTITSGVFNINLISFIVASIISRGARFFVISFLIWKFGPSIKSFIDKYFNILALAFTVLLIGSFFVLKYLI